MVLVATSLLVAMVKYGSYILITDRISWIILLFMNYRVAKRIGGGMW
jgi:hypothetical protein